MGNAKHTPRPWRHGKVGGCVVSDAPVLGVNGSDDVDYYGGHLIAESIAPQNVPLIAAAPDQNAALKGLAFCVRRLLNELPQKRDWLDPDIEGHLKACLQDADAAIAKAKGE